MCLLPPAVTTAPATPAALTLPLRTPAPMTAGKEGTEWEPSTDPLGVGQCVVPLFCQDEHCMPRGCPLALESCEQCEHGYTPVLGRVSGGCWQGQPAGCACPCACSSPAWHARQLTSQPPSPICPAVRDVRRAGPPLRRVRRHRPVPQLHRPLLHCG